jgi:hypothetical protein
MSVVKTLEDTSMTRLLPSRRDFLRRAGAPAAGLERAREFDRGTPVYVRGMTAAQLRAALGL